MAGDPAAHGPRPPIARRAQPPVIWTSVPPPASTKGATTESDDVEDRRYELVDIRLHCIGGSVDKRSAPEQEPPRDRVPTAFTTRWASSRNGCALRRARTARLTPAERRRRGRAHPVAPNGRRRWSPPRSCQPQCSSRLQRRRMRSSCRDCAPRTPAAPARAGFSAQHAGGARVRVPSLRSSFKVRRRPRISPSASSTARSSSTARRPGRSAEALRIDHGRLLKQFYARLMSAQRQSSAGSSRGAHLQT